MNYLALCGSMLGFIALLSMGPEPENTFPGEDGTTCVELPASQGVSMCMKGGDYGPRYYILPTGERVNVHWIP